MNTPKALIKVILADDHALFRQGLRLMLNNQPNIIIVAEAADGAELKALIPQSPPDVVLLDLEMPKVTGIEAAEWLLAEWPEVKIVVLSMVASDQMVAHLMEKGVHGYLLKDCQAEELFEAIEHVVSKGTYLNKQVSQALLNSMRNKQRTPPNLPFNVSLTEREREVLHLICEGLSTDEVAQRLFISPRTVEGHRKNLIAKFGVRNIAALVAKAYKDGWV